jgi:hypothetical protein
MKTDSVQPAFWMLEDVLLRCMLTADLLDRASVLSARLIGKLTNPSDKAYFHQIQQMLTRVAEFRAVTHCICERLMWRRCCAKILLQLAA